MIQSSSPIDSVTVPISTSDAPNFENERISGVPMQKSHLRVAYLDSSIWRFPEMVVLPSHSF